MPFKFLMPDRGVLLDAVFAQQSPGNARLAPLLLRRYLCGMIQAAEIEKMSLDERLQTMELLWASLACTPDAVPSPAWHGEVLAARIAKIERGEAEFLTVPELEERVTRRQ